MNRRELFRLAGMGTVAAASPALEFPSNYDASKELARADWKPAFLDPHQNETLVALSELVVPGSKDALANRFIDEILAAESRENQRDFLNAMAFLDGEAQDRYRTAFVHATPDQQQEMLAALAYPQSLETWPGMARNDTLAHGHFQTLKDWISRAYYSSEAGQKDLGWDGEFPHGQFAGCEKH
jgi:hypothetical protein